MKKSSKSKRLTKWEILCAIENLPGNTPWSASSLATVIYDRLNRSECVAWYNDLVTRRSLDLSLID